MPTHRMHLKGPWQVQRSGSLEGSRMVKLPATWQDSLGREAGEASFRRTFNRPTNLESHEHVWIVLHEIGMHARFRLNGIELGSTKPEDGLIEFELTEHLQLHNELVIVLCSGQPLSTDRPQGLWAPVALEIRSDDVTAML